MIRHNSAAPGAPPATTRLTVSLVYYDTDLAVFDKTLSDLGHAIHRLSEPTHVVIVDNSGRLDAERVHATLTTAAGPTPFQTQCLTGHGNVGFGRGHNLALASLTSADYHLILNPDVYLAPDVLSRACRMLDQRADAVALTPYAETAAGEQQYLCKRYPDLFTLLLRVSPAWSRNRFDHRIARYEARDRHNHRSDVVDDVELASGCCLFCRRDALDALGGFDPCYFLYFEDFDLSIRLRTRGMILHDPESRIVHLGGQVAQKSLRHWQVFIVSAFKFFRRHGFQRPRLSANATYSRVRMPPKL